MHLTKPLVIAGAVITAGVAGLVATQAVSARSSSGEQTIVDKIASTFNLNKADVQKVFDEERKAHEVEMSKKLEERVAQAVKDGKLTQALADQLLAKHNELRAYHEFIKDKEPEERRALMKARMMELVQWARDNNIGKELMQVRMHGGPDGMMGHKLKMAAPVNE